MNSHHSPTVLVIGAQGMVGHTVFNYLSNYFTTYGTSRRSLSNNIIQFTVEKDDLTELNKEIGTIDYIINCIGILPDNKNLTEMNAINANFPHTLAEFAKEENAKLIQISTDAVFSSNEAEVFEESKTSPEEAYGKSKLQGELNKAYTLTIRTSFLGLDPIHHRGLLEFVKYENQLNGYSNQNWSGCTTLQFAQLCKDIILYNRFDLLRKNSPVFHFVPIKNVSKHDIIKSFLKVIGSNKSVKNTEGKVITRKLATKYSDLIGYNKFSSDLFASLQELVNFENN